MKELIHNFAVKSCCLVLKLSEKFVTEFPYTDYFICIFYKGIKITKPTND